MPDIFVSYSRKDLERFKLGVMVPVLLDVVEPPFSFSHNQRYASFSYYYPEWLTESCTSRPEKL